MQADKQKNEQANGDQINLGTAVRRAGTPAKAVRPQDLSELVARGLKMEIQAAWNPAQLRRLGDEIIELTGYGRCQVLNTAALAHVFAFSGLPRAARLTRLLDQRSKKLSAPREPQAGDYHGYREPLTESDTDDPETVQALEA